MNEEIFTNILLGSYTEKYLNSPSKYDSLFKSLSQNDIRYIIYLTKSVISKFPEYTQTNLVKYIPLENDILYIGVEKSNYKRNFSSKESHEISRLEYGFYGTIIHHKMKYVQNLELHYISEPFHESWLLAKALYIKKYRKPFTIVSKELHQIFYDYSQYDPVAMSIFCETTWLYRYYENEQYDAFIALLVYKTPESFQRLYPHIKDKYNFYNSYLKYDGDIKLLDFNNLSLKILANDITYCDKLIYLIEAKGYIDNREFCTICLNNFKKIYMTSNLIQILPMILLFQKYLNSIYFLKVIKALEGESRNIILIREIVEKYGSL